jgi:hypothetical protein
MYRYVRNNSRHGPLSADVLIGKSVRNTSSTDCRIILILILIFAVINNESSAGFSFTKGPSDVSVCGRWGSHSDGTASSTFWDVSLGHWAPSDVSKDRLHGQVMHEQ